MGLVRAAFENIGYATTFALLNAADFGAPQRRVRLIMLGARQWPLPAFPIPTHAEEPRQTLFGRERPWVTLGDLLSRTPPPLENEVDRPSPMLQRLLSHVEAGSGLKSPGARETTRPGGHWGYKQGTFIADPCRPARTVTAAATQDWLRTPQGLRRLTWRECAGLQTFPSEWVFEGSKGSRFRQIGNAVPCLLGAVVGKTLLESLAHAQSGKCVTSLPWPLAFSAAVEYTKREQNRNGTSRHAAKVHLRDGRAAVLVKGYGAEKDRTGTGTA